MSVFTHHGRTYELLEASRPYFLGRWYEKEIDGVPHTCTVTNGAQVFFLVEDAEAFRVTFTDQLHDHLPYYACSIDGGEPVRRCVADGRVPLPDRGRHTVCLITDGMHQGLGKWYEEDGFALQSITAEDGRLWGIRPTAPLVFFYGDSLTEGIYNLGYKPYGEGDSATHAFPWYCAEILGVTPYYIGYGATGLIQTGWFHTLAKAIDSMTWQHPVEESPAANQKPDLIVICHGTNDMDYPVTQFHSALRGALSLLYKRYPSVPVVFVIPPQQVFATVIRRVMAEYPSGYVVESADWPLTYSDGIHPDVAGARVFGERVAEAIGRLSLLKR